jgi:tetratricopeptide (TPR) repeat protein
MKLLSLILLLCLVCSSLQGLAQKSVGAGQNDSFEKANRLFEQQRFDLALNFYKELTADQNTSALVLFRKAYCYLQCMQFQDAERVFGQLLFEYPEHQQGWYYLGYTYRMQGKYESAANCYDKLAELNPRIGVYWQTTNFPPQTDFNAARTYFITNEIVRPGGHELFVSLLNDQLICATTKMDYNQNNPKTNGPNFNAGSNQLCILNPDLPSILPYHQKGQQEFNTSHISFSSRTGLIVFSKNAIFNGMRQVSQIQKDLELHFALLDSDGSWEDFETFEYNDPNYSVGYPFLTENGNTLYFASNMPGGYGGMDLYVSYRTDNSWTVPQNLGPRINTPGDEISPFLEGSILFFASDWHPGYGGMDIFKTDFDYDSWKDPVNLGTPINSTADDFGYVFYEKFNKGYFISNRKGIQSGENLFEFQKTTKKVVFELLDFKRKKPITGALVDLSRCGCASGISDEKGFFEFSIQEGFDCIVGIHKVGYQGSHMQIRHKEIEGNKKNIKLLLNSNGYFTKGKVLINENDAILGLSGVLITAINEVDGEAQETYSEAGGSFELQIKPRGKYFISFVKSGFRYFTKEFQTGNNVDKEVLGDIILERADNVVIRESFNIAPSSLRSSNLPKVSLQGERTDGDQSITPPISSSNKTSVSRGDSNKNDNTKEQDSDSSISLRFVIQVAAIGKKNIDITPFKTKLSQIGELFYIQGTDNLIRIVVGVFNSRQEALDALQKVIVIDIFEKSFVSKIDQEVNLIPLNDLPQRNTKKSDNNVEVNPSFTENQLTNSSENEVDNQTIIGSPKVKNKPIPNLTNRKEYLVQIGRYKNLNWFTDRDIEKIGLIEERREGGYILVLLSGFVNFDDAKIALEKAYNLGYKESIIVSPNENGILEKITH